MQDPMNPVAFVGCVSRTIFPVWGLHFAMRLFVASWAPRCVERTLHVRRLHGKDLEIVGLLGIRLTRKRDYDYDQRARRV